MEILSWYWFQTSQRKEVIKCIEEDENLNLDPVGFSRVVEDANVVVLLVVADLLESDTGSKMMCKNPYMKGSLAFGCGQCNPCRFNRRRLWTHRIVLESYCHAHNSFATLTYSDENVPYGLSDIRSKKVAYGHLDKSHCQKFLKRLRKNTGTPIRYYYVGEYGDEKMRPHYHFALFGFPPCWYPELNQKQRVSCKCPPCSMLRKSWGLGNTSNDYLTHDSAQYVAGYVTKKMTKKDDPRLGGRPPEFGQPSLNPGIGANYLTEIPNDLKGYLPNDDVPKALQHGKKLLPLGRYLTSKLRSYYGLEETGAPEGWKEEKFEEMRELYRSYGIDPKNALQDPKIILQEAYKQKILNLESKMKIFSKKGKI